MPLLDVDAALKGAIEETLNELVSTEKVAYHLTTLTTLMECPGDPESEAEEHYVERAIWRLNLFVTYTVEGDGKDEERFADLSGIAPYGMCSDGDPEALVMLVREMWSEFSLEVLMASVDLKEPDESSTARDLEGRD